MWTRTPWTDRRMEDIVGVLLQVGVVLSALVVLFGGIVYLSRHGTQPADYRVFHGEPSELRSVRSIVHYALDFRGRGIIQLGLLMLIATPVARVAFSIFGFAAENDKLYMGFTALVLAILLYSLLGTA